MSLTEAQRLITDAADLSVVDFQDVIRELQEAFRQGPGEGRYWQGLPTHTNPPRDGLPTGADLLTDKPDDVDDDWTRLDAVPSNLVRTTINEYADRNESGYEIVYEVDISGKRFRRTVTAGPDTWDDGEWMAAEDVKSE